MLYPNRGRLATRRLYSLERSILTKIPALNVELPMVQVRALAVHIWEAERVPKALPTVVAGRGTPDGGGALVSYCESGRVELCKGQRNRLVLIHELAHAIGDDREYDHGPAFCARYFYLLTKYGV